MKYILSTFFVLLSLTVSGQAQKEPLLEVTGSARVTVTPDIGVLSINLSDINPSMAQAIENLGDKTNEYARILQKLNFKEEEIKTTDFTVQKNKVYRDREVIDSGYIASQKIRIEFTYKKEILSRMLNEITQSTAESDFSFGFKLSEELKSKVQNQIIELAVKDAKQKAELIARAADQKLVKMKRINYGGWSQNSGMQQVEQERQFKAAAAYGGDKSYNFTPDDLVFRDTISINWEIK